MKFSSSVFSFCFWWLILENEGPSLTSWSSVPLACYFLLLFSHWDGRADQSVALTPKSTFWQGCPTSWHTPAKFQAQNFFQGPSSCFFFFFLIRMEKAITAVAIYLSLPIRGLTNGDTGWRAGSSAGAGDLEHGLGRETFVLGLGSVLACPLHILSLFPPLQFLPKHR